METRSIAMPERFDCEAARAELDAIAVAMVNLEAEARVEADSAPQTAVAAYRRIVDPREGLAAVARFSQQQSRYRKVAAVAAGRSCPISDIDRKMDEATMRMDAFRKGA